MTGCGLFEKNSRGAQAGAGRPAPFDPSAGIRSPSGVARGPEPSTPPPASVGGILAGRVIDSYNRTPPPTFIQVTLLEETGKPAGAPIEVAADTQGYFVIPGLQPGRHYQLTARCRDGSHVLAGTSLETPPNPKVLIRISEDLASSTTPPVPGAPAWDTTPKPPPAASAPAPVWPEPSPQTGSPTWGPGSSPPPGPRRAVELGPPMRTQEPAPEQRAPQPSIPPGAGPSPVTARPQDIAGGAVVKDPACNVPPALRDRAPAPTDPTGTPGVPPAAQFPFCQLTGHQLTNFGLYDLNGQPFEFRRSTRGRIVLLDFWGTWCMPCQQAIPHLKSLQQMYGPWGLEVIGIDYEQSCPSALDQMQHVRRVCGRLGVNYRVLLGTDDPQQAPRCPVRQQFGISTWPTLVLLDENSQVIWRSEGLDARKAYELEMLIRQRLGIR
jgi:thiol-disulfide isomerase/thioredoxin